MIRAAAFAAMDARLEPGSRDPVAVAVSGGGDSIALLRLAAEWARRHRRSLLVLSVDHGLNPQSAAWGTFVAGTAAGLGLESRTLRWEGAKPSSGLPAAAREARHALLAQATRGAGARVLLMGHTADDVLEGRRMRSEGASVGDPREWSPSPAWPEGREVFLLRPLLAVGRDALRAWLRAESADWVDDPANDDQRFHRARVRGPSPLVGEGRSRRETDDGGRRDVGEGGATPHPAAAQPPSPTGGEGIIALSREEAIVWLGPAVVSAGGGARPPRAERLGRVSERLSAGHDFTATLCGARLEAAGDRVLVGREPGRVRIASSAAEAGVLVWDGRFEIETDTLGEVVPLAGRMAQLDAADRSALKSAPAWQRPTLPGLLSPDGKLRTVRKRCLVQDRFRAACGAFTREGELPAPYRGATSAEVLSVSGIQ